MAKRYRIAKATRELARGLGGGIVSDRIAVDGEPIGRMTRDPSTQPEDSGWLESRSAGHHRMPQ